MERKLARAAGCPECRARAQKALLEPNPLLAMAADRLTCEGYRFEELAKEAALKSVTTDFGEKSATLARHHVIRKETFQEAAAILVKMLRGERV